MNNCFAPIEKDDRVLLKPIVYPKTHEEFMFIPKASKAVDADGVEVDIIAYEVKKTKEVDIQEFIESYADDVGIQNILKKVALTGDKSFLNQTGRKPLTPGEDGKEPIQDYSNVPGSKTAAFNSVAAGVAAYDNLPDELKGQMSFDQFAQQFGQAQLDAFVNSLIEKHNNKTQTEGEDK